MAVHSRGSRRGLAAAIGLLVLFTQAPQANAGQVDRGSGPVGRESLSPADDARQRAQEPLLLLNDRVYEAASQSYDARFAGARLNVAANTLTVYWAGEVPASLTSLRDGVAKSGPTLDIRPARFSRRQLMAAADQVMPDGFSGGTVELAVDGSGITVATDNLLAVVAGARAATAAESGLLNRIAATRASTGVPVALAAPPAGKPQFNDTRSADNSPYWAGAKTVNSRNGNGCTSGFGMYATGSFTTRFTLTAAHCTTYTDDVTVNNGSTGPNAAMGVSDFIHELYDPMTAYDLAVVRLRAGASNAPAIYIDEYSSTGHIAVAGYATGGIPADGTYCVHGMIAIHCNLYSGGTVKQCYGSPPQYRCVYTIAMGTQQPSQLLWCRGDSGGPIYFWVGGTVMAAGVVSWSYMRDVDVCSITSGGASVVATAVNMIPGLRVVTLSEP